MAWAIVERRWQQKVLETKEYVRESYHSAGSKACYGTRHSGLWQPDNTDNNLPKVVVQYHHMTHNTTYYFKGVHLFGMHAL